MERLDAVEVFAGGEVVVPRQGRTHEGYVRCVDPEATMDGEGDTKAAAARTPSQS